MNVDHAKSRDRQQLLGDDASVGRDHAQIRLPCSQRVRDLGRFQSIRLKYRKTTFERERLYRRMRDSLATTTRPVWLGDDTSHPMWRVQETSQGGHRKLRCPEEHHYHLPVRESFLIFLTMRSF